MLENHLILALGLVLIILILIMVSDKLGISSAIFLVIAGLAISLIPGVPPLRLEPELLFELLLPPASVPSRQEYLLERHMGQPPVDQSAWLWTGTGIGCQRWLFYASDYF